MEKEADYSTDLQIWLGSTVQDGLYSKTSLGFLIATRARISESYSTAWMNSGIAWRGEFWMQNFSEAPKDAVACLLSEVIKTTAPPESFLGQEPLQKWLERHDVRGHTLPAELRRAIETQMFLLSNTPQSVGNQTLGHRQRGTDLTKKHTLWIHEVVPTLFVRRMLATEYEALQGFPENWTLVD
jgi:hypothetical protein